MRKRAVLLIQKLCRLSLNLPIIGSKMWPLVDRIRLYFGEVKDFGNFLTTFDTSTLIWVSLSDHIESMVFWQGVQTGDRGEVKLLKSMLQPEQVFFDIGANIGVFTLIAALRLVDGEVHAFEPSKFHLKKLRENVRINGFNNVIINPVGLSNSASNRKLYFPKSKESMTNTGQASFYVLEDDTAEYNEERITTIRLDDYVEQSGIQKIDVVKIDVEGAEMEILEGGLKTLKKFRPRVVMEVSIANLAGAGETLKDVIDFWNRLNYGLSIIKNDGKLIPVSSSSSFGVHQNIYCCPEESLV